MSKHFGRHLILMTALVVLLYSQQAAANDSWAAAEQLYQSGQWQQAAKAFGVLAKDSRQSASTHQMAQVYVGESLVQLGRYADAKPYYLRVQQQHPPALWAAQSLFRLGEVAWMTGDEVEANKLLTQFVEQYPLNPSVSHAKTYLTKISKHQVTKENFAVLDEAVGWERAGRHDAALSAYRELLKQQSAGSQVHAETLRRAAKLHESLSQSREALRLYQQFLAGYPQSERAAEVLAAAAWLHVRLDQPTQAADQFRGVCSKFPQSAQAVDAAYWLARYCADNSVGVDDKQTDQSMSYVDWLLERENLAVDRPRLWGQSLCLKCRLLSEQGRWPQIDSLVETVDERVPIGPLQAKLGFWSAEASFRLQKYDEARTRFKKLVPQTIGIDEPWTAMIPLRRAQLAARRQQWGEVLKILDQLEHDFPKFELDYEVDYLRGRALAGRGSMTAARKFYQRVLDNQAAIDTEAATMAGWMTGETYFHQRDYTRARSAYEAVVEQAKLPEWQARAALQAGKCWELEDKWIEAAKVYATARERWPGSASDQELESRMRWAQSQTEEGLRTK